jgi:ActR/RegA family two-component response regulator
MERKRALVVEDNEKVLAVIKKSLEGRGYDVTSMLYNPSINIPTEKFDLAIVDGLNGNWIRVLADVDASRKFLYTGNGEMIKEAKKSGFEAYSKLGKSLREILN